MTRPAMLAEVPDELPLQPVPYVTDSWHVTWQATTASVVLHRRTPSGKERTRHVGYARTPTELAALVRDTAQELAATLPCPSGKKRFRTESDASHALAQALTSPSERRRETRRYQCGNCGDWHLTSLARWAR